MQSFEKNIGNESRSRKKPALAQPSSSDDRLREPGTGRCEGAYMEPDGGGRKPEPDRLSNILKTFNENLGTLFTEGDQVMKRIRGDIVPKVAADEAYKKAKENMQVYTQFGENESFRRALGDMAYALASG
jgi:hypothetical protein